MTGRREFVCYEPEKLTKYKVKIITNTTMTLLKTGIHNDQPLSKYIQRLLCKWRVHAKDVRGEGTLMDTEVHCSYCRTIYKCGRNYCHGSQDNALHRSRRTCVPFSLFCLITGLGFLFMNRMELLALDVMLVVMLDLFRYIDIVHPYIFNDNGVSMAYVKNRTNNWISF